ncbi:MAG: 4'-phosphopantetheinyl transferase superfamily protein [Roseofilum sp. Belize BBD 4]|uniref:holo-ACP synthase n=1 Tax=Roseofilum sp. Belize BBD 4 TaxID=2821500 RepID=UPI001AFE64BB|nr:4'-phosphopantetheinyl transferase superfamily protein [Roseofilum sp. Belize BBD 4]MBP0033536.1 4'-phosphopantetheinyl transferase superfamily protein [Roseofilum sp. Belize BBD 4]
MRAPVWHKLSGANQQSNRQDGSIAAIGIDLVEISRVENFLHRYDRDTLTLIFASKELDASQLDPTPAKYLALCFASKEALGKALGTGLAEIHWFEIAAQLNPLGHLSVDLSGSARQKADELGWLRWEMSWLSWQNHLLVCAIAYQSTTSNDS